MRALWARTATPVSNFFLLPQLQPDKQTKNQKMKLKIKTWGIWQALATAGQSSQVVKPPTNTLKCLHQLSHMLLQVLCQIPHLQQSEACQSVWSRIAGDHPTSAWTTPWLVALCCQYFCQKLWQALQTGCQGHPTLSIQFLVASSLLLLLLVLCTLLHPSSIIERRIVWCTLLHPSSQILLQWSYKAHSLGTCNYVQAMSDDYILVH